MSTASPWRHRVRLIAFVLSAFLLGAVRLHAQSQHGSLYYSPQATEVMITGCVTATTGEIVVPETIGGLPVTILGTDAFRGSNASVIRLPASLTSIYVPVFSNCPNLTAIHVSAANPHFESVGGVLFDETKTQLFNFPGGVGGTYVVPQGVSEIVGAAFSGNKVLTGVSLPSSLKTIGGAAFFDCTALEVAVIPEGVTQIMGDAFNFCHALKSVSLPQSLQVIGWGAFLTCDLEEVVIPGGDIGNSAFWGNARLSKIHLGAGVKSIGNNAFGYCAGSEQIIFPASLQSLEPAFEGWSQLTSAVFLGAAPAGNELPFQGAAPGFVVYYAPGAQGFTTPEWRGHAAYPRQIPVFTSAPAAGTGVIGTPYLHAFAGSGLPGPVFTLTAGALPGGLALAANGGLSGTPTATGTFTGTVTASNGFPENATQAFSITVRHPAVFTSSGGHGVVSGGGGHPFNSVATLTAVPSPGYVFMEWSGDASGSISPLSVVVTSDKTIAASFGPDHADNDQDDLSNYEEIVEEGTDPNDADTDGDGYLDGYEVRAGRSPMDANDTPALAAEVRTAVELTFSAAVGKTYRVSASEDAETWSVIETGIQGTGGVIQRFFSTRNLPKRFFRVDEE